MSVTVDHATDVLILVLKRLGMEYRKCYMDANIFEVVSQLTLTGHAKEALSILRTAYDEDYQGEHEAPGKNGDDSPLYDLTLNKTYPDDIYSMDATRYYGQGLPYDPTAIAIIQQVQGKPQAKVKIYRAIPNFGKELDEKIKDLAYIIAYHSKHNFFPMKNTTIYLLQDKYDIEKYSYDEQQELILKDLQTQIAALEKEKKKRKKLVINKGDWVSTTLQYAKDHGRSNLNNEYKVLTKTVPAKHLWTDGNSIHEYGYDF